MKLSIKKSGRFTYLYAVKGYRDERGVSTSKVVRKFGTIEDLKERLNGEDPVEWARAQVAEMTSSEQSEKQEILVKYKPSVQLKKNEQRRFNGGYLFLQKIYHELGLDRVCKNIACNRKFEYDLDGILSRLIYTRIMYPGSKRSSLEESRRYMEQPGIDLHEIYRALSVLSGESDFIQSQVYRNSQKVIPRKTGVIYYDCTNYYFESEEESGLRQYGLSKDHRPNPIVQMGLFMDMEGIPLAFNINPGNTSEQLTMRPLEQKLNDNFKISKLVVCTDAGLSSYENRKSNDVGERAFITVQSLKKLKNHLQEWALNPEGWHLKGSDQVFDIGQLDEKDGHIYHATFYKSRWINENGLEQKLIVTYSLKYRDYLGYVRNRQVERAQKTLGKGRAKLNSKRSTDYRRFINQTSYTPDGELAPLTSYSLDREMVEQEERFDGYYGVCTDLPDDDPVILKYNSFRWKVEDCLRVMKTDFVARPVFLQRDDRIKAHFLTCFLSLLIMRLLEKKVNRAGHKFSVREISSTLAGMDFCSIPGEGFVPTYTRNTLTDHLHGSAGFRTDTQIITKQTMRKIISSTRKRDKE
ncbi:transposase [Bacteroidia bacterium]|nr:transposase [Bacteroidia bacterium]